MMKFRFEPYDFNTARVILVDETQAQMSMHQPPAYDVAYDHYFEAAMNASGAESPYGRVSPQQQHMMMATAAYDGAAYNNNSPGPMELPQCALHRELEGVVTFVMFPEFFAEPQLDRPKDQLARLFVGQLPYHVTPQEVAWMVMELAGLPVAGTECIKRWSGAANGNSGSAAGKDSPKGCVHTYCLPEHKAAITDALHRRVLIDDGGVWFAESAEEKVALEAYCTGMVKDKTRRFRERPYQPVVVQEATSTFVPHERHPAVVTTAASGGARRSNAGTPPPAYDDFAAMSRGE